MSGFAMNQIIIIHIIFVFSAIMKVEAANILAVFPTPSFSHQIVFRPLMQELAKRGHKVVIITTDPVFPKNETPRNLTEIDVHNISYTLFRKEIKKIAAVRENDAKNSMNILYSLNVVFEHQLKSEVIQNFIRNNNLKFDLVFTEACVPSSLIFSYIFKAPAIQISTLGPVMATNAIVGAPGHPLHQPIVFRHKIYNLSFWEKVYEIYQQFKFLYIDSQHEHESSVMFKNIFGKGTPTLKDLYNNVNFVFLYSNAVWNDNQPLPPNVIYIGGIHLNPAKELPTDLKTYLDNSKVGVIYVSFGTNVQPSVLPPDTVKMMTKVLSELPYNVIWRWNIELPEKHKNIKVVNWVPQSDILRHENLKLFITQGGIQSTDEAIAAGVPLIGMPVIADQFYNAQKYVRHGIGKQLDIERVTEQEFKTAVTTVIEDDRYRNNIRRLRIIMTDTPETPLERAIWWTEYVLRHGGAQHLRSPVANMSWAEYYEINLVLIIFLIILALVCGLYVLVLYVTRSVIRIVQPKLKFKVT